MNYLSTNSKKFPFTEAEKLYNENKKYFLRNYDMKFEDFCESLNGNLWACMLDNKFLGAIYFDLRPQGWFLSGFAKRKVIEYVSEAINDLCNHYFNDWRISAIYADTNFRHAKFALLRAGFKQLKTDLYIKRKVF